MSKVEETKQHKHSFVADSEGEFCEICGIRVIDARELAYKQLEKNDLSIEDEIIVIVYLLPKHKSFGITKLMKEIFLTEREGPKIVNKLPRAGFVPHRFGPSSKTVYKELDELESNGLIKQSKDVDVNTKSVELTNDGIVRAKQIIAKLDENKITDLKNYLVAIDRWHQHDLLRYVYNNYPTYLSNSEIKDKILKKPGEEEDVGEDKNSRRNR